MSYQSIFRPDAFANKVVIVTGGGSGIGRCTAHELAALGAQVVITGRKIEKIGKGEPRNYRRWRFSPFHRL